jgi:hypothetical protein
MLSLDIRLTSNKFCKTGSAQGFENAATLHGRQRPGKRVTGYVFELFTRSMVAFAVL